jgi:hypothetical protein
MNFDSGNGVKFETVLIGMWISLLVLATSQATENGPLLKYASYVAAHPRFAVKVDLSYGPGRTLSAELKLDRGHALRIDSRGPGYDYTYSVSSLGEREVDRVTQLYDERPEQHRPYTFQSRLDSRFALFLPPMLLADNLQKMASPSNPFKFKALKDGVSTYSFDQATQQGYQTVSTEVRADGCLVGVGIVSKGPSGNVTRALKWTLSNYRDLSAKLTPSAYAIELPDGFVPYSLPQPSNPAEKKTRVSFRPRMTTLVILADPNAPFARALSTSIGRIERGGVPVKWVGKSDATLATQLNASMLPYFVLVKPDGIILKNWLGFDTARAAAFESDVRSTALGATRR